MYTKCLLTNCCLCKSICPPKIVASNVVFTKCIFSSRKGRGYSKAFKLYACLFFPPFCLVKLAINHWKSIFYLHIHFKKKYKNSISGVEVDLEVFAYQLQEMGTQMKKMVTKCYYLFSIAHLGALSKRECIIIENNNFFPKRIFALLKMRLFYNNM